MELPALDILKQTVVSRFEHRLAALAGAVSRRAVQLFEAVDWVEQRAGSVRGRAQRTVPPPEVPAPRERGLHTPSPSVPIGLQGRRTVASASARRVVLTAVKAPATGKAARKPRAAAGTKVKRGQKHRHQR